MILLLEKQTPLDAWNYFWKHFETSDILWTFVIIAFTYGMYKLSTWNVRRETATWRDVTYQIFSLMALVLAYYAFGKVEIDTKGNEAYWFMLIAFMISALALLLYANFDKNFTNIINSISIGIIGFAMFFTIIIKEFGYLYAIGFGFLGGIFIGKTVHFIKLLGTTEGKENKSRWDK